VAVERPDDLVTLGSDSELASYAGRYPAAVGDGDLFRTLGEPQPDRQSMQRVEVDGLRVVLDGRVERRAVAHVVLRRSWWRGPVVGVMNVSHLGQWRIAPRAHPNDGLFDVVEVSPAMTVRDRWAARGRLPAGGHVPHPEITQRRVERDRWTFDRPIRVWADGIAIGRASLVEIELDPDHHVVHF
jgi:hypothetical protein